MVSERRRAAFHDTKTSIKSNSKLIDDDLQLRITKKSNRNGTFLQSNEMF